MVRLVRFVAWIESHQEIGRHPKTKKLARLLGISLPAAIGHLHLLWWWAMDFAMDGDLSRYDEEDIADGAMWEGDAEKFLDALIQAGFVDQDDTGIYLHDWDDYAGKLIERKSKDNTRKKDMRRAYENGTIAAVKQRDGDRCRYCNTVVDWTDRKGPKGGTYDHIDPNGPSTEENLVVCCRSCNSKKGGRRPEEAGMRLLPIPHQMSINSASNPHQTNLTIPNHTIPNQESSRSSSDRAHAREGDLFRLFEENFVIGLNQIQKDRLGSYLDDGMEPELIKKAIEITKLRGKDLDYFWGVLNHWFDAGIKTVESYEYHEARRRRRGVNVQSSRAGPRADSEIDYNALSL